MKKHLLLILDGYGIAEDPSVSAIDAAKKPFLDEMFAKWPHGTLDTSGPAVGLPAGQMGNSEVGHMNLGAGRVVYQEMTRIDEDIRSGAFFDNKVLLGAMRSARAAGVTLHLMGLLSDGGVHAHIRHVEALVRMAADEGFSRNDLVIHAFMDGRDTDPHGGVDYIRDLEVHLKGAGAGRIGSVIGRYWSMDRDRRWERTEKAYRLLVEGKGTRFESAEAAVLAGYDADITDEFLEPAVIGDPERGRIGDGDSVVFFNFRADRARQILHALKDPDFEGFDRQPLLDLYITTFTPYEASFSFPVAFPKVNLTHTLGAVIAGTGSKQLRAAETEKYPHVTYFFNGGREDAFPGEERILIPSPKVATYDLQPEMSAPELAAAVAEAVQKTDFALVVVNFANPDMVGHTGVFEAAVKAVEAVDAGSRVIIEAARASGYSVNVIADHGNAEKMINPDGTPNTAHTTVPVPHLVIVEDYHGPVRHGKLADVAPTVLHILGIEAPAEMTGNVLVDD